MKVWIDSRLIEQARIASVRARSRIELRGGGWQERERHGTCAARRLHESAGRRKWSRGDSVEYNVEVAGIVGDPNASANYGASIRETVAQKVQIRGPGKANARGPIVLVERQFGCRARAKRKRGIEDRRRTGLTGVDVVDNGIERRGRKLVTHTKVERQVWPNAPVVLNKEEEVILCGQIPRIAQGENDLTRPAQQQVLNAGRAAWPKRQGIPHRISSSNAACRGATICAGATEEQVSSSNLARISTVGSGRRRAATKLISSEEVRQEEVIHLLMTNVSAKFQRVISARCAHRVLPLVHVDLPRLRQVVLRTESRKKVT